MVITYSYGGVDGKSENKDKMKDKEEIFKLDMF
jgi:hypothetical protein